MAYILSIFTEAPYIHGFAPNLAQLLGEGSSPVGPQDYMIYLFIYLLLCIIKSRQTREMKYNTKRIAEVQKIKTY